MFYSIYIILKGFDLQNSTRNVLKFKLIWTLNVHPRHYSSVWLNKLGILQIQLSSPTMKHDLLPSQSLSQVSATNYGNQNNKLLMFVCVAFIGSYIV